MLPLYLGIVLAIGASIQAQKQMECLDISGQNTCPVGYLCREGQCEPDFGERWCSKMMPCGLNHECIEGSCVLLPDPGCQTNDECKLNEQCTFGICVPDESNEQLPRVVACSFPHRRLSVLWNNLYLEKLLAVRDP
nr:uncharacterized protein LOC105338719 [Crassostrea gigas]